MNIIQNRNEAAKYCSQKKIPLAKSLKVCVLMLLAAGKVNAAVPDSQFIQNVSAQSPVSSQTDSSQTDGGLNVFSNSPPAAAATGTAIGTSDINLVSSPSVQATAHVTSTKGSGTTGNTQFTGGGNAVLTYYFEITTSGVSSQIPINVLATTGINVKGTGGANADLDADASITLINSVTNAVVFNVDTFDQNGGYHSADVTGDYVNGFKGGTNVSLTPFLLTNTLYAVELYARAGAGISNPASDGSLTRADATAFVDPSFLLVAGYDPNVYHLNFSAGIQNVAPVPVPAAAWLFGSGLLSLLSMTHRKIV